MSDSGVEPVYQGVEMTILDRELEISERQPQSPPHFIPIGVKLGIHYIRGIWITQHQLVRQLPIVTAQSCAQIIEH